MSRRRIAAIAAVAVSGVIGLAACGSGAEVFNDAEVTSKDTSGAEIISFPDHFSNVASKCNHGNRVYVIYHGTNAYGSVAVAPNDPSCADSP